MSSSDTFGVRSELRSGRQGRRRPRHRLISVPPLSPTGTCGIAAASWPAAGLSGRSGQPLTDVSTEQATFPAPLNVARKTPLDAAEQRNAEDSPPGIARHCSLGLSG